MLTRRDFIRKGAVVCAALATARFAGKLLSSGESLAALGYDKEASYYKKITGDIVQCTLCPHECALKDGQRSFCRVREPKDGKLYTFVYGFPCSVHVDPIEKKPIYHMLPGSSAFSIATAGCNLRCKFCQNWQISQEFPENVSSKYLPPEEVVRIAEKQNCRSIAYTYSEPTVFYEYMYDTSRIAKERNIKNVWVTGGFINREPLLKLAGVMDAANIDLKGFSDKYLQEVCGERLEPLLKTLKLAREQGIWIELTNLVVPTLNDDPNMIGEMCSWIKENLGADTPLHFSRFWPMYKLNNLPPTPIETLKAARQIAEKAGLNYVYLGNVPEERGGITRCPNCKKELIDRHGYSVKGVQIEDSKCKFCNHKIAGIWS
ncbi:MAG: AmmeMemoRadiSam system radical SAM enzyme [Candidatus Omnitrophota bacterium]